mgnify:CR=1 FL=1
MSNHRQGFSKALYNRRLLTENIPSTWATLREDGVWYNPTRTGYQFYCGRYAINNSAIAKAWNLSANAVTRIAEWLATQQESIQCVEDWDWE